MSDKENFIRQLKYIKFKWFQSYIRSIYFKYYFKLINMPLIDFTNLRR
jgi:hypothetical protein